MPSDENSRFPDGAQHQFALSGPADDELLEEMRAVLEGRDPVPGVVHEAALIAFELRTIDDELAELVADSAVDVDAVLVRGGGGDSRLVSFASPRLSIEFEVTGAGSDRRLVGQVIGEREGPLTLDHRAGVLEVFADELGRFIITGVSSGPVRLRCALPGGGVVATSWLTV